MSRIARISAVAVMAASLLILAATPVAAQGRGNGGRTVDASAGASVSAVISLSDRVQVQIRSYYESEPAPSAEALPPGIRRNLARGKPLPPGIAKKSVPGDLRTRVEIPAGYELVEVGLDVLLVEVATNIVHDVLMDVIR